MIHFLLLPVVALAVVVGLAMLVPRSTRRVGAVLICASILAYLLSLAAVVGVIFGLNALGRTEDGLLFIAGYVGGLGLGGAAGLALGAWLGWRLTRPKRPAAEPAAA